MFLLLVPRDQRDWCNLLGCDLVGASVIFLIKLGLNVQLF